MTQDMTPLRVMVSTSVATIDDMIHDLQEHNHTDMTKLHEMLETFNRQLEKTRSNRDVHNTAVSLQRIRDLFYKSTSNGTTGTNSTSPGTTGTNSTSPGTNTTLRKELDEEQLYLKKLETELNSFIKDTSSTQSLQYVLNQFNDTISNISSPLRIFGGRIEEILQTLTELEAQEVRFYCSSAWCSSALSIFLFTYSSHTSIVELSCDRICTRTSTL